MLNLFPLQRRRKLRRRLNLNRKMTTWASVSSIRLSSLFYLYVYTVSTINDMADFCICICVTDFVYFHMLYNHCGYTIPGVVTGNG